MSKNDVTEFSHSAIAGPLKIEGTDLPECVILVSEVGLLYMVPFILTVIYEFGEYSPPSALSTLAQGYLGGVTVCLLKPNLKPFLVTLSLSFTRIIRWRRSTPSDMPSVPLLDMLWRDGMGPGANLSFVLSQNANV